MTQPCPECGGTGTTIHPRWQEYWERFDAGEAGQTLYRELFPGGSEPAAQEVICPECEGAGRMNGPEGHGNGVPVPGALP